MKQKKRSVVISLIPQESIESKILFLRGKKVILDANIAQLYKIPTKRLNEQVKRNIKRFPKDFMFQLNKNEFDNWRSQIATSNYQKMGLRRTPYAFTEQGVAMLSSVLNSKKAILVNIAIIRTFVKLREIMSTHKELAQKISELERRMEKKNGEIQIIFETINQLLTPSEKPKRRIGFHNPNKEF